MKRLYVSISLIVLAIFVCVFSSIKVEKSSLQMKSELEGIGHVITQGDADNAEILLKKASDTWKKTERLFSFIVDADKIEEMNIGFYMIRSHLEDDNTEHALERLRECVLMLDEIMANEKLSIKNIM